ncbi:DNA repair protein RadA [Parvularcula sp. ZS-1/3]|uniref:DNA repair protein RadA n=1 Tax=Parvularcula mediterranea TaxID=2732508 RepID=A0A7Y3W580_9PROT|nr:DNA repair protein RadA [Parvularcula mediterranea]NNU16027.1 DNA repair protein RadA [Parvularcula mediterranea]
MARASTSFVCQSCGSTYSRWQGRCDDCGSWNTIEPEEAALAAPSSGKKTKGRGLNLESLAGESAPPPRFPTGAAEFDRALGGGLVPGSALLVGGDPGVGKSTLLLQTGASIARSGKKTLYISGEEALDQIRLRATRLGVAKAPLQLGIGTALKDVLQTVKAAKPDVLIIDSIQTMWSDDLPSAPGTVAQVRTCAAELTRFAKNEGCTVIIVGHVTKEGQIAGPRVVEHLVDVVLYFETEPGRSFRLIRAVKNRYGPANEIGVFEMQGAGLIEVPNPSELFLGEADEDTPGTAVFAGTEGSRPLLCEFQALVLPSQLAQPRRAVVGWDSGRLSQLLAVLAARSNFDFGRDDVFLSVAGGLRITDPAADLAAALALMSAKEGKAIPARTTAFGEIGLSGKIRRAAQAPMRLSESYKLGFVRAAGPADIESDAVACVGFSSLHEAASWLGRA